MITILSSAPCPRTPFRSGRRRRRSRRKRFAHPSIRSLRLRVSNVLTISERYLSFFRKHGLFYAQEEAHTRATTQISLKSHPVGISAVQRLCVVLQVYYMLFITTNHCAVFNFSAIVIT